MEKPSEFVDIMVKRAFSSFTHTYQFVGEKGGTTIIDIFEYKSPFGPFGIIADKLFLEKYMTRFIFFQVKELE